MFFLFALDQSNGKNALLKALLNLKDGRNDTVEFLLDVAEKMGDLKEFVNAAYTDSYYRGHTALHIAIERRSKYFVELLVRKGADVHAKACGKFFQPHDGPSFYFGELPLSLAACTNQRDVVDFLMDNPYQKVNIMETDSLGNTVLHALVLVADNSTENTNFINSMYDHILTRTTKLHPEILVEDIENKEGLNPLKLAAKTGKIGLFRNMIQREFNDKEIVHLSRKFTEWVYGPVQSSLYDLASVDSYEKNSVMEIIVYGSTIPAVLFIIASVLYCCGKKEYLGFMVLCLALSWINLLHFSRGSRHMGIYNVMIQQMILGDVLLFLFVYMVYLFGFSAAVVTLIDDSPNNMTATSLTEEKPDCKNPTFNDFRFTTLELFKFTIGMGDLEFTDQYQYKEVFYVLLISYIVFTYILLLNMLIALMNKTVEKLSEESRNIWKLQRAVTILDLERSLPSFLRRRFRSGVEKKLGWACGEETRWCFR
ncbi:hypothetical protein Z043_118402 [Scleropages formosus]|uniref:Ion transport domain-containing protein n=1 Tax=Scleropages formosus TaxID=113540 RepID=A0A0P7U723_SCLFO|nr:hypothetical protein Z043_118402 [Scleropages formosus]